MSQGLEHPPAKATRAALLATVLLLAGRESNGREGPPPIDVLVVVLDTTRADFVLGAPEGAETPRLAELASTGRRFEMARSTSAWTLPAHGSLFTGLFPSRHGAHHEHQFLDGADPTLAELLAPTYSTVGFSENPHISRAKGFARGFGSFEETWRTGSDGSDRLTIDLAVDWLRSRNRDRPFFMFVNLMNAHLPYSPPEERLRPSSTASTRELRDRLRTFDENDARRFIAGTARLAPDELAALRDLYRGEVETVDDRLGSLIDELVAEGTLDRTLVVVVGDHGENLGEHGLLEHQFCLCETLLRIPLVLRLPGVFASGSCTDAPAQILDLAPTILDVTGIAPHRAMEGTSLLVDPPADRPVYSEYMRPILQRERFRRVAPDFNFDRFDRRLASLSIGGWKLVASSRGEVELYDLDRDPGEVRDLAVRRPEIVDRLKVVLDRLKAGARTASVREEPPALDEETIRKLRALGYIR